jgi:hypothetical protein
MIPTLEQNGGQPVSVRLRNGATAMVWRLEATHWCWECEPTFCLRGYVPGEKPGERSVHQWQQSGAWRVGGLGHPMDLIL